MKNRKWSSCLPLAVVMVLLVFSPVAHADLYWESVVETGGAPEGLPKDMPKEARDQMLAQFKTKTDTAKYYLSSCGSRTETSDSIIIIDFDTMIIYQLNPTDKTYTKIDMMSVIEHEKVKDITKDVQITPTNEKKEIAGYKCKKYLVTVMGFESEHWLSKDVRGYEEYKTISEGMIDRHPRLRQMNIFGVSVGDGFPVKTITNMMGMKSITTLKKIQKRPLSRNLFKIPGEYRLKAVGSSKPSGP